MSYILKAIYTLSAYMDDKNIYSNDPFSSFRSILSIIFNLNIVNNKWAQVHIYEEQPLDFLTHCSQGKLTYE